MEAAAFISCRILPTFFFFLFFFILFFLLEPKAWNLVHPFFLGGPLPKREAKVRLLPVSRPFPLAVCS